MTPAEALQKAIDTLRLYADEDNWYAAGDEDEVLGIGPVWFTNSIRHGTRSYEPAQEALKALDEARKTLESCSFLQLMDVHFKNMIPVLAPDAPHLGVVP